MTDQEFVSMFVPQHPALLDEYSIVIRNESDVTGAWDGQILRNGAPIIAVENSGNGGCHSYSVITSVKDLREFEQVCVTAYGEEHFEPQDSACVYMEMRDDGTLESLQDLEQADTV